MYMSRGQPACPPPHHDGLPPLPPRGCCGALWFPVMHEDAETFIYPPSPVGWGGELAACMCMRMQAYACTGKALLLEFY